MAEHYEYLKPMVSSCLNNKWHWQQLAEDYERRIADMKKAENLKS